MISKRSDVFDLATFVVVEPGDTLKRIEATLGFPIDRDAPPWEWVLDHGGVLEAPIVTSDDGSCTVLIVPDITGIDPSLMAVAWEYAEAAVGVAHGGEEVDRPEPA